MSLRDYAALTKPKIVWLLLLVALASAVIAARTLPPIITLLGLFLAGSFTSLGSLAINSYLEMDVDAKMKRTRNRPLPGRRIVQPRRALAFGLSLVALGLVVSWFTLTPLATLFIGLGSNTRLGGSNAEQPQWVVPLPRATVEADGVAVLRDGVLMPEADQRR